MKEKEPETPESVLSASNDNGARRQEEAPEPLDPRIRVIARAIGRHIAREHIRSWEKERREQAANDNGQE